MLVWLLTANVKGRPDARGGGLQRQKHRGAVPMFHTQSKPVACGSTGTLLRASNFVHVYSLGEGEGQREGSTEAPKRALR